MSEVFKEMEVIINMLNELGYKELAEKITLEQYFGLKRDIKEIIEKIK